MSEEFNKLLKKTYQSYQDRDDSPIPLKMIRDYLEYEGINVDEEYCNKKGG